MSWLNAFFEKAFSWENFISQFFALATFFAFPAIQYSFLKYFTKKEGNPELWFLPKYGFRLVIRNIPNKKVLSEIKYKTLLRKIVDSDIGESSVATLIDDILIERDEMFLSPGYDLILLNFKIDRVNEEYLFVMTNKLGQQQKTVSLKEIDFIISDYTANLENWFNFDIKISKRVFLRQKDLIKICNTIESCPMEQRIEHILTENIG